MELTFRPIPAGAGPGPGELLVRPRRPEHRGCLGLARVVLEHGLDALPRDDGPIDRVVVGDNPTLDELLAATIAIRLLAGAGVPPGLGAFAEYAKLVREGLRPGEVPLEASPEGIFLAIRNADGDDLADPAIGAAFAASWTRMAAVILRAAEAGADPFAVPHFAGGPEFARERAFLARDHEVFRREDIPRGERWRIALPGGPPRATALVLRRPKSLLFKHWSRLPDAAPGGDAYLLLAVDFGAGLWVFSTDPVRRLSLKPLADALQAAESALDPAAPPWFDGARFGHTLIAHPDGGSRLPDRDVLRVARRWARARPLGPPRISRKLATAAALLMMVGAGPMITSWRPWSVAAKADPLAEIRAEHGGERPGPVEPPSGPRKRVRRSLHVLTIGVANYADKALKLKAPVADAMKLFEAFDGLRGRSLFAEIKPRRPLIEERATRVGILRALEELQADAGPGDLVVVALAGHGTKNRRNQFYFLASGYGHADPDLSEHGIWWEEIVERLSSLIEKCFVLVVIDTCDSGAATIPRVRGRNLKPTGDDPATQIDRVLRKYDASQKGLRIMAASLADQQALESEDWGHGALTLALLEGIGQARIYTAKARTPLPAPTPGLRGECLTLKHLERYVEDRVAELTDQQTVVIKGTENMIPSDIPFARFSGSGP